LIIHLQQFGCELESIPTCRVTMLEDGREQGLPPGRTLVLGTKPDIVSYPLTKVQWFWVEEE
jgi:hypothetical protein